VRLKRELGRAALENRWLIVEFLEIRDDGIKTGIECLAYTEKVLDYSSTSIFGVKLNTGE
jgi:hypothetical protein